MIATSNRLLTEIEAKSWLAKAGIPVVETRLAKNLKEALAMSKEIGFPVVMKIVSPDISHKSDVGGVVLNLQNAAQVERAYRAMLLSIKGKMPQTRIEGVSIQKMAKSGVELILGLNMDAQFGPVLMFGLGGVLVEVLKDISFRLVPVTSYDAAEMVKEIKGYALLKGYRGQDPVNIPVLEKTILALSRFIEQNPQIQELDINPLYGYKDGVLAVDVRIVVKED